MLRLFLAIFFGWLFSGPEAEAFGVCTGEQTNSLLQTAVLDFGGSQELADKVQMGSDVLAMGAELKLLSNAISVNRAARMGEAGAEAGKSSGGLVHLTDAHHGSLINQSGVLRGDIYVGPLSNSSLSGSGVTARTGLSGSSFQAGVRIPTAGEAAFSHITPIGPITGWQRLTGQQYMSRGVLDLQTGVFQRTGINWNQAAIYSLDAGITSGGATAIGLNSYLYKHD